MALVACGGPANRISTVVIRAEVSSVCSSDGGCSPATVSVAHCGPRVYVPEQSSRPARVVTDRSADELGAVVIVRHDLGDKPAEAANGGINRGWLLSPGEKAHVEALHRSDVALYAIGDDGEPSELHPQFLYGSDGGTLEFRYTAEALSVTETHRLVEVSNRPVEVSSPSDILNGCCASIPGQDLAAVALLATLVWVRRRRP